MASGTKIGGGNISLKYRLIFVFSFLVGLLVTIGFYFPRPVKESIKAVLKRM